MEKLLRQFQILSLRNNLKRHQREERFAKLRRSPGASPSQNHSPVRKSRSLWGQKEQPLNFRKQIQPTCPAKIDRDRPLFSKEQSTMHTHSMISRPLTLLSATMITLLLLVSLAHAQEASYNASFSKNKDN